MSWPHGNAESQPAILSLLLRVGDGCAQLHNRRVRDVDGRPVVRARPNGALRLSTAARGPSDG
ncbi:hypothetical protein ACMHYB_25540 [Sorangium sp. So ce1128]